MSGDCCAVEAVGTEVSACPESGTQGRPVAWQTVAALSRGPVPPRQQFRLCRDADCGVVYYGDAGAVLRTAELHVAPGFKASSDGLVCYCFEHRRSDIACEIAATGKTDVLASITGQVQAGNCACEVRNPSGKCCLGEVQRAIRELEAELVVTA